MNFGETLAYWYLRLNGFIPMTNLVLHEPDIETGQHADTDVIAVRFPHVFENIGGWEEDWDNDRFNSVGLRITSTITCVICEVKTGRYKKSGVNRAFGKERLSYALNRVGVIPRGKVEATVEQLLAVPVLAAKECVIAKLLIDEPKNRPTARSEDNLALTPCWRMTLREVSTFVHQRMNKYKGHKGASRLFFPGELIQYFAWAAGVPLLDVTELEND